MITRVATVAKENNHLAEAHGLMIASAQLLKQKGLPTLSLSSPLYVYNQLRWLKVPDNTSVLKFYMHEI